MKQQLNNIFENVKLIGEEIKDFAVAWFERKQASLFMEEVDDPTIPDETDEEDDEKLIGF